MDKLRSNIMAGCIYGTNAHRQLLIVNPPEAKSLCAPLSMHVHHYTQKSIQRSYITEKLLLHIFFINHQVEDWIFTEELLQTNDFASLCNLPLTAILLGYKESHTSAVPTASFA